MTIADTMFFAFCIHMLQLQQAFYIIHLYYFGVIFWYRLFPVIAAWKEEQAGTDRQTKFWTRYLNFLGVYYFVNK